MPPARAKQGMPPAKQEIPLLLATKQGILLLLAKGKKEELITKEKERGPSGFFSFLLSALGFVLWRVADLAWRFTPSRIVTSLPRLFARLPGPSASCTLPYAAFKPYRIQRTLYERVAAHGCRDAGLSESSWHGPGRPLSSLREAFLRAVLLLTLQLQPLNKLG